MVTDIVDPHDLNPVLVFQKMAADDHERRRQRNRDPEGNEVDIAVAMGREELWHARAGS